VTPRSKGIYEIHHVKLGTEEEHGQSRETGRLKTALGWGICEGEVEEIVKLNLVSGGRLDWG
jgi:hypothetical protein